MLCDKPVHLIRNEREVVGACGTCKQCRAVRRRDVIGRALAEGRDPACQGSTFITLTYGHDPRYSTNVDHPHASELHYEDVQKWIKRIRKRKIPGTQRQYRLRYAVAGEYGALNGRAHWHALVWWQSELPEYSEEKRWSEDPFWSEGFTNWSRTSNRAVAYVAKYVSKSNIDPATKTCFHGSFRPLIGGAFFRQWAELHVERGLPLNQGRKYQLRDSMAKSGRPFDYWMTPAAARLVVRYYLEAWERKFPGKEPPYSRLVEKYLDDEAKPRMEEIRDAARLERVRVGGHVSERRRRAVTPSELPPRGYEYWFDDSRMVFVAVSGEGHPELYWNDKAKRWMHRIQPRKVGLSDLASPAMTGGDPLPDLPGELPREFRRPSDIPEFEPGQAFDFSSRRTRPGERERYALRKAQQYHEEMLPVRMGRVAEAIKRFRDENPS